MKKNRWKYIVGIIISAVFLIYALAKVDYAEVVKAFSEASYGWTIPMMLTVMIAMVIRALRWRWLLNPIKTLRFGTLFSSVMIGFMANNVLPARIGEVVRAISLSKKHSLSRSSVFATVVAERVFDSLGLLFIFYLTLLVVDYPDDLHKAGLLALFMTFLMLIFLYLLKVKTDLAVKLISNPVKLISIQLSQKIESILRKFAIGLSILTSPGSIVIIFLYSVFLWIFTGAANYLIFIAFGLYPTIWASFILLFVSVLAVSLPSSPGYIGTFHAACIIAFNLIGSLGMFGQEVSKSVALSYSIILWSCQFFPITFIGLYYLKKEHLSFKEVEQEE
jgi:uncharacterized protein (TIRG00374 family)